MERERKIELLQRALGLRHKIKVHESMQAPESHEDLAVFTLAKWDLEDELKAIEELLEGARGENVKAKRLVISKDGPHIKSKSSKKK